MKNHKARSRNTVVALLAALALIGAAIYVFQSQENGQAFYIDPGDRQLVARGEAIYGQHCASCHGAGLEGQPDWRTRLANGRLPAPPHDESGHTWHHPDPQLFDIVKNGLVPGRTAPPGYESDMPAYGNVLSDEDILAVLAYIKSRWPEHARQAQKEVTLQSQQ